MARFDLCDTEWSIIQPLLPNKPRGVRRKDDRRVLNGIFYTLRTGSQWRDLPERYGPYTTVYNRYNRWAKAGVWLRVFAALRQRSPGSLHLIDSSIMRAHQHAAGGKRGPGSRHRPFSWRTEHQDPHRGRCSWPAARVADHPGQACDETAVAELLDGLRPAADTAGDRGYDAQGVRDLISQHGSRPHIPNRNPLRQARPQLPRRNRLGFLRNLDQEL